MRIAIVVLIAALSASCRRGPQVPDPLDAMRVTYDRRDVKTCDLVNTFAGESRTSVESAREGLVQAAREHGANTVLVTDETPKPSIGSAILGGLGASAGVRSTTSGVLYSRGEGYACPSAPVPVDPSPPAR
jgi:hypothetical protein